MDKLRIGPDNSTLVSDIKQSQFIVYPNPSNGLFQIKPIHQYDYINIKVRDLSGKLIYVDQPESNSVYTIDLSNQAKGVYLLEINVDQKVINQKLIIK